MPIKSQPFTSFSRFNCFRLNIQSLVSHYCSHSSRFLELLTLGHHEFTLLDFLSSVFFSFFPGTLLFKKHLFPFKRRWKRLRFGHLTLVSFLPISAYFIDGKLFRVFLSLSLILVYLFVIFLQILQKKKQHLCTTTTTTAGKVEFQRDEQGGTRWWWWWWKIPNTDVLRVWLTHKS